MIIRADANARIGFGHVMRCLALAQSWQANAGPVIFASHSLPEALATRLAAEGFVTEVIQSKSGTADDARELCELLQRHATPVSVIDGYHFDTDYQRTVRQHANVALVIDDCAHQDTYVADVLLNQNPHADPSLYAGRFHGELLTGLRYALLRTEFLHAPIDPVRRPPRNLLVTLGGSDPENVTQRVIDAVGRLELDDLSVTLVSGMAGLQIGDGRIQQLDFCADMARWYRWADIAICGGGSTNWEMSWFGLPRLQIVLADNQLRIAHALEQARCCVSLGWHETVGVKDIATALHAMLGSDPTPMHVANRQLVDGNGARRVVERLLEIQAGCAEMRTAGPSLAGAAGHFATPVQTKESGNHE